MGEKEEIAKIFDLHAETIERTKELNEYNLEQLAEIGIDPETTGDEALEIAINILTLYADDKREENPILVVADMATRKYAIRKLISLREQGASLPQEKRGVEVFPGDGEF